MVLDEITALPVSFIAWVAFVLWQTGSLPSFAYFFSARTWPLTLGVFVAFRFFDMAKPWPVHQSQSLPGGWGVTIDDVLARFTSMWWCCWSMPGRLLLVKVAAASHARPLLRTVSAQRRGAGAGKGSVSPETSWVV